MSVNSTVARTRPRSTSLPLRCSVANCAISPCPDEREAHQPHVLVTADTQSFAAFSQEPTITPQARAWLASLACDKAKKHGYPHELWTTRLLADHAREHGLAAGHTCLAKLVQGTVCKLLAREEIKPHKVRHYLEQRDTEFEQKMAMAANFMESFV